MRLIAAPRPISYLKRWQGRQDSNPRPAVLETWRSLRCAPYLPTHALCAKTAAVGTEDHLRPRLFARRRDRRLREPLTRAAGARTGEDYNISAQSASLTPELTVRGLIHPEWGDRLVISCCVSLDKLLLSEELMHSRAGFLRPNTLLESG